MVGRDQALVGQRHHPRASLPIARLVWAHPVALADDTLTIEFPPNAAFHRGLAEEPKNATILRDTLFELTGRRLALAFVLGEGGHAAEDEPDEPAGEDAILQLVKETFDAREVDE